MFYLVCVGNAPIFYLHADVQGIVSAYHAAEIGREVTKDHHSMVTVIDPEGTPHNFRAVEVAR